MITFTPGKITIKEDHFGNEIERTVDAMIAEGTGLAYVVDRYTALNDLTIWVAHIASGMDVGGGWCTSTEREAQQWIEKLHELVDWTAEIPVIRPQMYARLIHFAAKGVLDEVERRPGLHTS